MVKLLAQEDRRHIEMAGGRILATARVNTNNTVSLPREVREKLKLKPRDQVVFIEEEGKIFLIKGPVEVKV